jgi:O-methyltransferase
VQKLGQANTGDSMNKTLANLLHTRPLFNSLVWANKHFQLSLVNLYREPEALALIDKAFREADLQMNPLDAYSLYSLARMQANVPGSMVEIGMYRGGSAGIICHLKGNKKFYGFDTFEGLPSLGKEDEKWFRENQYSARQDAVTAYLAKFTGVTLTKGRFPESGSILNGERLSFVNLDVDLYKGMIDSLNFLWEKMNDRGLILIHDTHLGGVKKAIAEFLEGHNVVSFDSGCSQMALIRLIRIS